MSAAPITPTTEQLLAAMAQGLLPLAGPWGLAASAVVPAAEQLLAMFKSDPTATYTVDDLTAIVAQGNTDLAKLQADIAAQKP